MKALSGLLKFIAILIMIFVVLALPFTLMGRNIARVVFSPEAVKRLVEDHFLNVDTAALVAEQLAKSAIRVEDPERNPVESLMLAGMANLKAEQWVSLFQMMAPRPLLLETSGQIIDGFYTWLDNDAASPDIVIDARPWKTNISANALPVFELVLNALPQCTPDQFNQFLAGDLETMQDLPLCKPPEPVYSTLLAYGAVVLPAQLQQASDEMHLGQGADASQEELLQMKQSLRRTRFFLRAGWMFVIVLYLVGIAFGARSIVGALNWAGIPLLLSGVGCLLLALVLFFFSEALVAAVLQVMTVGTGTTPAAVLLKASLNEGALYVARPLLLQAALLILLGGGAVVVGVVLAQIQKQKMTRLAAMQSQQWQSLGATLPPVQPPSAWQQPASPSSPEEQDDKSRPSGMFG